MSGAFRVAEIITAVVMLIAGLTVCSIWLLLDGSLPIPLASGALASLGVAVLLLELHESRLRDVTAAKRG
jgi:CHASE2 domain-containing sensor protein